MSAASWEGIAHVLERETVSDVELAARVGCMPEFVAGVRADLRMEPLPGWTPEPVRVRVSGWRSKAQALAVRQAYFESQSEVVEGGHRRWLGRVTTKDQTPLFTRKESAYREAFRLMYRREPDGSVRVECEYRHCVEGLHLSDRIMRERL